MRTGGRGGHNSADTRRGLGPRWRHDEASWREEFKSADVTRVTLNSAFERNRRIASRSLQALTALERHCDAVADLV